MAPVSPRAFALALALAAASAGCLGASCASDPDVEERALFVYSPRSCPVSQDRAYSVVYGNGDFDSRDAVSSFYLRDLRAPLDGLSDRARAVVVDVTDFTNPLATLDWRGAAEIPARGPVNVLVWPGGETCSFTRNVERRVGSTFATFGRHLIVVGGSSEDGARVPGTYVGDLYTGIVDSLPFGLGNRRLSPSVTGFPETGTAEPSPALVAGGEDPESGRPLQTAQVYVPRAGAPGELGDFEERSIELSEPRKAHGAVVLANGETLLVGGLGQSGAPLRSMEIVDPVTRRTRTSGVALLTVARWSPTVLRLASGEILVAGGFDADGQAVPTLEWLAPDASGSTKRPVNLVTGRERAFVALDGGGALAVVAAPDPAPADFLTVWVISADGTLEAGLPIDPATLDVVRLFPGTGGAPALWTGRRWLRWEPWFMAFQPIPNAPADGPDGIASASGGPGLALWLEERGAAAAYVAGYRFDTRTRFSAIPSPLLVEGTSGLAPDRAAGLPGSSLRFVAERGLELGPGASAFLTDVTFADVTVELDVEGATPDVVLRQEDGRELEVGGAACAFRSADARAIRVERRGTAVTIAIDGGEPRRCPTDLAEAVRVSVGLRGADGIALGWARNLRVVRQ